jgi:hypothetical protein
VHCREERDYPQSPPIDCTQQLCAHSESEDGHDSQHLP